MIELDKNSFGSYVNDGIVLVEAGGELCSHCQELKPKLKDLEDKYPNIKFAYFDAQKNKSVAIQYKIMGLPVVMLFESGEMKKKWIQAQIKIDELEEVLKKYNIK